MSPTLPVARAMSHPERDTAAPPADDAPPTVWPLSRDGIQGAVREAIPALTRCYESALARDPSLAGTLAIGFEVEDVGGVGRVRLVEIDEGRVADPALVDCALDAFEALQFDPPADGGSLRVSYPVTFRSEADAGEAPADPAR